MAKRSKTAKPIADKAEAERLHAHLVDLQQTMQIEHWLPKIQAAAKNMLAKYKGMAPSARIGEYVERSSAEFPYALPAKFPPKTKPAAIKQAQDAREILLDLKVIDAQLKNGDASLAAQTALRIGYCLAEVPFREWEKYIGGQRDRERLFNDHNQQQRSVSVAKIEGAIESLKLKGRLPRKKTARVEAIAKAAGVGVATVYRHAKKLTITL